MYLGEQQAVVMVTSLGLRIGAYYSIERSQEVVCQLAGKYAKKS